MKLERSRINRLNNGFTSQKVLAKATSDFNLHIHEKAFDTSIMSGKAFLPAIGHHSEEKIKTDRPVIALEGSRLEKRKGSHKIALTHREQGEKSASDGAHNSMPKYSDVYSNVKNAAQVAAVLKQGGGRPE